MTGSGSEPGDFVELDVDAVEVARVRDLHESLVVAARELSAELGCELRVAVVDGAEVLADQERVKYRVDAIRNGRLELTVVLADDLL